MPKKTQKRPKINSRSNKNTNQPVNITIEEIVTASSWIPKIQGTPFTETEVIELLEQ